MTNAEHGAKTDQMSGNYGENAGEIQHKRTKNTEHGVIAVQILENTGQSTERCTHLLRWNSILSQSSILRFALSPGLNN